MFGDNTMFPINISSMKVIVNSFPVWEFSVINSLVLSRKANSIVVAPNSSAAMIGD